MAQPAKADSAIASNLSASGLISIGRVNLSEFAFSGLGLNPHYGTPVNPFGKSKPRAPGGSSSGTGVAIASNIVPCGIGTDTGGSVRIPSSFNGLVGFKSSADRIDKTGVFPLSQMLDTIGPIGRSVEDCILLDAALRRKATNSLATRSIKGIPIYQVLQSEYFDFKNTRPSNLDNFMQRREEILSKDVVTDEDIKYLIQLDAEIGSLPSGETLNDFQTMHLLNKILKENKSD